MVSRVIGAIAGFICLAGMGAATATAQQTSALPVEEALSVRSFPQWSTYEVSPVGKWLTYAVKNETMERDDRNRRPLSWIPSDIAGDIWLANIETGETRNLTNEKGNNWFAKWSPDGRYLAFLSDRDGSGQVRLWLWDAMKNDLRRVSDINIKDGQGRIPIEWTPDSRAVFVITSPEGVSTDAGAIQPNTTSQTPASENPLLPTGVSYQSNATKHEDKAKAIEWGLNDSRQLRNLVKLDIATGRAATIVRNRTIASHLLSPDGLRLAYSLPRRGTRTEMFFDLAVMTLATGRERIAATNIPLNNTEGHFSWAPNGEFLVYRRSQGVRFGPNHGGVDPETLFHDDCYTVSAVRGSPRNITHLAVMQRENSGTSKQCWWGKSGKQVYFVLNGALWQTGVVQERATPLAQIPGHHLNWQSLPESTETLEAIDDDQAILAVAHDDETRQEGFYKMNLASGESTRLLEGGQCYTCGNLWDAYAVTPDKRHVVYWAEDAQRAWDLWFSDTAFKTPRRLTHLNPAFDNYRLGAARLIDWLSDDGERLHGALLLPSDYQSGKRYPLVVDVGGGEWLSRTFNLFGFAWRKDAHGADLNMQLLATRGYAVLLPDSPGHEATALADVAKTVLPGVNKVIDLGIADPERLGVMGHSSAGGIAGALALIVQTRRFKAAVEGGGTADLVGLYGQLDQAGTTDTEQRNMIEHEMGGTPWQFRDRYLENSALFYLDRVETPLLIVHGTEDGTVAPFLGDQIFVAMRRLGKEVEYVRYEGEGHFPRRYANQLDFCNRVIGWFDKYLRARE